jgi:hypothetical protein
MCFGIIVFSLTLRPSFAPGPSCVLEPLLIHYY